MHQRLAFLRVVETFPPMFSAQDDDVPLRLSAKIEGFVEGVRGIRGHSDLVIVATVKNPAYLKLSSIEAASILRERAEVESAPVIVVRDANKLSLLSSVLTCFAVGLRSVMLVWGDAYPPGAGASNVRDFRTLSDFIAEASAMGRRSGAARRILAPVDLSRLGDEAGVGLARSRLDAGADLLLAQPPTTDSGETFESHVALLEAAGLADKVLLNVFPFRSRRDVLDCEKYFGWSLPKSLHRLADSGEEALLDEASEVVRLLRKGRFPGVYLATRGTPSVARRLLG
jgi:5,10-methylenetetrahydrofolate reductase